MRLLTRYVAIILALLPVAFEARAANAPSRAAEGMVVSANDTSSQIGVQVLAEDGNAVDAAVATAFALAVTHPTAGNIGGGGFLVLQPADDDPVA